MLLSFLQLIPTDKLKKIPIYHSCCVSPHALMLPFLSFPMGLAQTCDSSLLGPLFHQHYRLPNLPYFLLGRETVKWGVV